MTAAEIGAALGASVTLEDGPTMDCEYQQEDLRAPSGSFGLLPHADVNGGYAAYAAAMPTTLNHPTKHEVTGVGSQAVVYVGPNLGGGTNMQATGAADLGNNNVLVVTVAQGNGLSESDVFDIARKLLTVLSTKVG